MKKRTVAGIVFVFILICSCSVKTNHEDKELELLDTVKIIVNDSIIVNTIYKNNRKIEQYVIINEITDGAHSYFNELENIERKLYITNGYILSDENYYYSNDVLDSVIIYSYLEGEKRRSGEYFSLNSMHENSNWFSLNDHSPYLPKSEVIIKKNTNKKALLILGDYNKKKNEFEEYSDTIPFGDSITIELKGNEVLKRLSGQIIFYDEVGTFYVISNRMFFVQYFISNALKEQKVYH